jgi:hypothetical protein
MTSSELSFQTEYAKFDDSQWPLLVIQFSCQKPNEALFKRYLDTSLFYLEKQQLYYCVFDISKVTKLEMKYISMQIKWLKQHYELLQKYSLGHIVITSNIFYRFVFRTILLFQETPMVVEIVKSTEEAINWVKQQNKLLDYQQDKTYKYI